MKNVAMANNFMSKIQYSVYEIYDLGSSIEHIIETKIGSSKNGGFPEERTAMRVILISILELNTVHIKFGLFGLKIDS